MPEKGLILNIKQNLLSYGASTAIVLASIVLFLASSDLTILPLGVFLVLMVTKLDRRIAAYFALFFTFMGIFASQIGETIAASNSAIYILIFIAEFILINPARKLFFQISLIQKSNKKINQMPPKNYTTLIGSNNGTGDKGQRNRYDP